MIRGIIFDCFGVLYGGSYQALQELCPIDKLGDLHDLNRQADYGFITSDEYVRGAAELIGKPEDEVKNIFRAKHVRNDALMAYAVSLKGKCKLALLSNVSNGIVERLFSAEDLAIFDEVILSYQEHITKPNPAVFTLAAERLGLHPEECVMVDDLAENCEGAEVIGMASIQHTFNQLTTDILSKMLHTEA